MMIKKDLRLAGYLCLVLGLPFLSQIALAQGERGAISGTVTDESGAVIPGAQIAATHVTTDVKTDVATMESGNYYIPALPPGIYKVIATKQGFKQTVAENVRVVVGTTVNIDLKMPVGETSQSVTVLGESRLLQTTPEIGNVSRRTSFLTACQVALAGPFRGTSMAASSLVMKSQSKGFRSTRVTSRLATPISLPPWNPSANLSWRSFPMPVQVLAEAP
ncbi:MAG: hypothetical protein DMG05_26590 [Acidobacteria bacterium]|nr:MAG: hypothetical protein DMG05_26590 [Acidobacteriota bacterium]